MEMISNAQMRLSLKSEFSESEFSHDQLGIVYIYWL
jgi:hypothetical protein